MSRVHVGARMRARLARWRRAISRAQLSGLRAAASGSRMPVPANAEVTRRYFSERPRVYRLQLV